MVKRGHPRWTRGLFAPGDLEAIAAAVAAAERETSAEIRVHLVRRLPKQADAAAAGDALAYARDVFVRLRMHETAERNGVLVYLAVEDRKLAIVGDEAIHGRVGDQYWAGVRDAMVERLRRGAAREAVLHAVADVGGILRKFFPHRPDDRNELSDQVSLG
jgi:uncharacterized membrane protein